MKLMRQGGSLFRGRNDWLGLPLRHLLAIQPYLTAFDCTLLSLSYAVVLIARTAGQISCDYFVGRPLFQLGSRTMLR